MKENYSSKKYFLCNFQFKKKNRKRERKNGKKKEGKSLIEFTVKTKSTFNHKTL